MTTSKLNNPGIIYFVEEKDLLGYSTPNYVKIGLVNYLVDEDKLLDKAIEISNLFFDSSAPVSVAMTRHMLWSLSADDSPENAHIIESKLIDSRGASDDAKEGVMSFLEKRHPDFKNKISSDLPKDFPWRKSRFDKE